MCLWVVAGRRCKFTQYVIFRQQVQCGKSLVSLIRV